MKAVLVINEMPNECYECPCYNDEYGWCLAEGVKVLGFGQKSRMCPLRPLPKKKTEEEEMAKDPFNEDLFYDEYIWGWNACLDAITGETDVLHK